MERFALDAPVTANSFLTGYAVTPGDASIVHHLITFVVDPQAPANVYVGADLGVWHSGNSGATWRPLQNGLPDAPVYDLQIHQTQRLLRAATHGRGLFEIALA